MIPGLYGIYIAAGTGQVDPHQRPDIILRTPGH
jgi:hypothetical protein